MNYTKWILNEINPQVLTLLLIS